MSLPSLIFLAPYFNTHLGVPLAVVGLIFLVARIGDIVIDPWLGSMQDKTVHAFGRRRIWMVGTTPVLMALIALVFLGFQPGASPLWLSVAVLLMYAAYAAMMIAHLSWAGELQPDYHGRTQTLGMVQIAGMVGYVLLLLVPAVVVGMEWGGPADAVHAMGIVLLVAFPLTVWACVALTPERQTPPQPHATVKEVFQALKSNPALRRVLIPDFLIGMSYGVTAALFVFLFRYHLGFETEAETLLLIYFVSGLLGIPIWTYLGRRFGKHRSLQIGCLHAALMLALLPFLPKGNLPIAIIGMVLAGVSQSAGTLMLRAMMADVVDEEEARTGANRSGLFFGLLMTTGKVGVAVGPITFAVLDAYGFDAKLGADNTPVAMAALVILYAVMPLILNVVSAASVINYPLDEAKQAQLRAVIAARKAAA
jgi:Na+/melibiose symporter-like transporter